MKLEPAPLVPSVSFPPALMSNRSHRPVDVVILPLITVSPAPSKAQARLSPSEFAATPPPKVRDLPATMWLAVRLALFPLAANVRTLLKERL